MITTNAARGFWLAAALALLGGCGPRSVHVLSPLEDGETVEHSVSKKVPAGGRADVALECKDPAFAREIVVKYAGGDVTITYTCAVKKTAVGALEPPPGGLGPTPPDLPATSAPRPAP